MRRFVIVVFGEGWGSQLAEVLGSARPDGRIPVRKWRAQGRKWTGRTLVDPARIRGAADGAYLKRAGQQGAFDPGVLP